MNANPPLALVPMLCMGTHCPRRSASRASRFVFPCRAWEQVVVLILCAALSAAAPAGENWPEFRGPHADGHSDAADLPVTWSQTENVAWKTPIHDRGWSSPVVWGDQVWVTTATADGHELFAVCVDRKSGRIVHDVKVFDVQQPEQIASVNSYASPTPAIEEGRVYLHYGTYGTACLDTATAKALWTRRDLNCDHHMGPGSSPILFEDLLIFQVDGMDAQYVVALDKRTGKTAWRADRSVDFSRISQFLRKSYSTPRVYRAGDRLEMVSPGAKAVMGYDPRSGEELWKVRYYGWSMVARPLVGHGLLFVVVDYDHPELWAIRPGGNGDVTETHLAWRLRQGVPSTPSLLLIDALLFMVSDRGVAACVEANSGQLVWQERLGGNFSASPLFADGTIYFSDHEGTATVMAPGRKPKILARNRLDAECRASPAAVGSALFVRTATDLYRIEKADGDK